MFNQIKAFVFLEMKLIVKCCIHLDSKQRLTERFKTFYYIGIHFFHDSLLTMYYRYFNDYLIYFMV